jgi:hypothetical protein
LESSYPSISCHQSSGWLLDELYAVFRLYPYVTSRVTNKGEGKILQSVTTFVDSDQEYFYSSAAYFVNYNGHAEGRPE